MRSVVLLVIAAALLVPSAADAAFPGQNGKIAFSTYVQGGSYEVFSMNPDGTEQVNLSDNPISDLSPAWSADGKRIAWTHGFYDNYEIWSMSADGTDQRNLSNAPQPDIHPGWAPDGSKIAFATDRDEVHGFYSDFDIWLMNPDGTGQESFTSNLIEDIQDVNPAWSPDGTRIAFAHGVVEARGIYVIDVATKTTQVLTSGTGREGNPSWSPDGSKLAFDSRRTGDGDIYVMNADGSGLAQLTDNPLRDDNPSWSPDGTKIVFIRGSGDGGFPYVMNADGSQQVNVTASTRRAYQVDWQPIPGPRRSDYKNAAEFCKAEQAFWGSQFAPRYGGGANAYGKCVSGK